MTGKQFNEVRRRYGFRLANVYLQIDAIVHRPAVTDGMRLSDDALIRIAAARLIRQDSDR